MGEVIGIDSPIGVLPGTDTPSGYRHAIPVKHALAAVNELLASR